MTTPPTIAMQAGAVRHVAATAPENLRPALDAAAATLDYHARHPDLMRACAYMLAADPSISSLIQDLNELGQVKMRLGKAGDFSR